MQNYYRAKYFYVIFVAMIVFSCVSVCSAEDIEDYYVTIFSLMENKQWKKAYDAISALPEDDMEKGTMLGAWYSGDGNPKYNFKRAVEFLEASANKGSKRAQVLLAASYIIVKNIETININRGLFWAEKIMSWLDEKIESNDLEGIKNAALMYTYGIGYKKDIEKAYELYSLAEEMGDEDSANNRKALQRILDERSIGPKIKARRLGRGTKPNVTDEQ